MRLQKKSYSRLNLGDLLRRRRSTLRSFLDETGIVTYELLKIRCESMGVVPPPESDFNEAKGNSTIYSVSSPTEGIVVLDALEPLNDDVKTVQNTTEENPQAQKKKQKKTNALDLGQKE